MRKVIDTNFLQDARLESYFLADSGNRVVLTDYVAMEVYKTQSVESVAKAMSILSRHPTQVIILKGTQIVCGLKSERKGQLKRMIDRPQTRHFGRFCTELNTARQGDDRYVRAVMNHGKEARQHLQKMLSDLAGLPDIVSDFESEFSRDEIRRLRRDEQLDQETQERFVVTIMQLAAHLFADHPRVNQLPDFENLLDAFIFRVAACGYLRCVDWIAEGGAKGSRPERHRNDAVDSILAAYATYFDGFLTNDRNADCLYMNIKSFLNALQESP